MIKLSRSGWNNVIIFAVMGFILLINATQKHTNQSATQTSPDNLIIGQHQIILSLTVNQQTYIERIGQNWQATPNVLAGQPLNEMMNAWHETSGEFIEQPENIDKSQAIVVSMALAGKEQTSYFMLVPTQNALYIFRQSSNQWFIVAKPIFSQLIPPQVIL